MRQRRAVPVALVLDRDQGMLRTIEQWLRPEGWTVLTTSDAVEATSYIDVLRDSITVLIADATDLELEIDAIVLHAKRYVPTLGVLYASQDMPSALSADTHHIQKPFTAASLNNAVRALVPTGMHFAVFDALQAKQSEE